MNAEQERDRIVEYLLSHPYDCQTDIGIGCEACARENAAMEIKRGEHWRDKGEWYAKMVSIAERGYTEAFSVEEDQEH